MYFLIFERSPLTKIHLSYKSLSRIQDSDNGVPATGISCFSLRTLKFNPRSRRKKKRGGEEGRERNTTTNAKLKAEVYLKNGRRKYSKEQSRGYMP